ncbi:uncharacterized protein RAG0_03597 [Rhynchosporium agropyri]|uniref:Geranylgeranyl pyrophosphate synthetase n=1 Tax=Rhynchosporium agropyri TaxID=914238 RepID=A0A1E1K9C3_9HELO|nr:uncharacterized protein RAG0_03597 [Rhynchosporium agropyri]
MSLPQNQRGRWNRGGRPWRGTGRAGRGGGTGLGRGHHEGNGALPTPTAPPQQPLGLVVDTIDLHALLVELDEPDIQSQCYVASYNWINGRDPVIIVPAGLALFPILPLCFVTSLRVLFTFANRYTNIGSPPAWTPLAEDKKLKPDSEDVYRDINAARYPKYPMEPAVRSVLAMSPDFELASLDIVGCGSTIGNLLTFAGSRPRAFRFDVNVRIIQYDFGGLQILIRTETDGYLKPATPKMSSKASDTEANRSLENALDEIAVSTQIPSNHGKLEIKMGGEVVHQSSIFDIKTRAGYKPYNMEEILPRLWTNQTSKFLLAYHEFGLFDKPGVTSVAEDILKWQKANSSLLARFHALLKRIVDVVTDTKHTEFEISWDGQGPLCITKQIGEGRTALPSDLVNLWDINE